MSIVERIKNAMSYGGFREVLRKAFFLFIYKITAKVTIFRVKHKKAEYGVNHEKRDVPIIVSLTSFPKRFPYIGMCLKSIVIQELKPDRIIVYLGSDSDETMLTDEMKQYQKYGVEYRFDTDNNLMPHKKYFYAMQDYPNAIIITADDDVVYPTNWVSSLYKSYKRYPNAVSARRVHYIQMNDNKLRPYDTWKDQCRSILEPSMRLISTGNSGVLYPPMCFDSEAFNIGIIKATCLRADDLWLKCMEVRNRIPVVWVKNWQVKPATIDEKDNTKLQDENIFTGNNDAILEKLMDIYSLTGTDFK